MEYASEINLNTDSQIYAILTFDIINFVGVSINMTFHIFTFRTCTGMGTLLN
jgi:hypothetical protein